MSTPSPEARILRDLLLQYPGALGELLLDEHHLVLVSDGEKLELPALDAARVLGPWTPDGDPGGSVERVDLVSGLLAATVLPRSQYRIREVPPGEWVGLVFDHHNHAAPEQIVAGAGSREEAQALVDALLLAPERRWRLL